MRPRLVIVARGVPVVLLVAAICKVLGAGPDTTLLALYRQRKTWA